jgi:saccharopine dehydrogenase-like NADP-dependent oxidoreductase
MDKEAKKHAVILGSGMVGSTMAMDLARGGEKSFAVTVVDARAAALDRVTTRYGVATRQANLADAAAVTAAIADADVVLGALPSTLGLATLRTVIAAAKPYVDISFMAEDATELHSLAVASGARCVVDCGVAPGVSNMMAGYAAARLDPCTELEILVGGLPVVRCWPFDYKAGFAPYDVIEEYVRPARMVEGGRVVVKEALSEPELVDCPGVGTLEAFNTDGLRSLIKTLAVPHMREKTLRYPGHIQLMRVFRETGLFGKEPIDVGGARVRPLDLTSALLFPKWTYADGEADLTVMTVRARGHENGVPTEYAWTLHDTYDAASATRSMSRTTAFPATLVARLLADGRFPLGPGVYPPETPAATPGFLAGVLAGLEARGLRITAQVGAPGTSAGAPGGPGNGR